MSKRRILQIRAAGTQTYHFLLCLRVVYKQIVLTFDNELQWFDSASHAVFSFDSGHSTCLPIARSQNPVRLAQQQQQQQQQKQQQQHVWQRRSLLEVCRRRLVPILDPPAPANTASGLVTTPSLQDFHVPSGQHTQTMHCQAHAVPGDGPIAREVVSCENSVLEGCAAADRHSL